MSEIATTEPRQSVAGFPLGSMGITPPSDPGRQGAFLTDVIIELGFADPSAVNDAMDATSGTTKTAQRYLVDSGVIDEWQLSLAVAERNCLDHVDLDQFDVDPEAASLIGKSIAKRYTALPVAFAVDGALLVAIEDPFNMLGISDIEVMTRNEIRPVIATGTQIRRQIEQLPERTTTTASPDPAITAASAVTLAPQPTSPPQDGVDQLAAVHELPAIARTEPDQTPAPPEPVAEPDPSASKEAGGGIPELGELVTALATMQDGISRVGSLFGAVEQRIGNFQDAEARAEQAQIELSNERAEYEQERERNAQRELELEGELTAAREHQSNERAEYEQERDRNAQREMELEGELTAAREQTTVLEGRLSTYEQERDRNAQRDVELEGELTAAREQTTVLEGRLSRVKAAAELASAATEKLVELQGVLKAEGVLSDEQTATPDPPQPEDQFEAPSDESGRVD